MENLIRNIANPVLEMQWHNQCSKPDCEQYLVDKRLDSFDSKPLNHLQRISKLNGHL